MTDHVLRSVTHTQRDVAATYRRRTGRDRPPPPYPPAGLAAWRDAHRAAGMDGSWTHTPPRSSVALLSALAEHGPLASADLVAAAGVTQGNATSRGLPRLDAAGLVTAQQVDSPRYRGRTRTEWAITRRGRDVLAALTGQAPG